MVEKLKPLLLQLSAAERAELASYLLASLEPAGEAQEEVTAAWEEEAARRVEEIRDGRAVGRPAEQILAELREQYPFADFLRLAADLPDAPPDLSAHHDHYLYGGPRQ